MNKICNILQGNQNSLFDFRKSEQYKFFITHKKVLKEFKIPFHVNSGSNAFDIICKNAIISSVLNKKQLDIICQDLFSSIYLNNKLTFEEFLKYYHARIVDLKSFKSKEIDIYIPIYSHLLNEIYLNHPLELIKKPYSEAINNLDGNYMDLFGVYNFKLFDSNFTKLIKIKEYEEIASFYDFDSATLFFINKQGKLDYFIPIFDKYMEKINTSGLINRLIALTEAFYNNDRDQVIEVLSNKRLISEKMKLIILKKSQ